MSLIVPLAEANGVSRFGGKANALAELLSLGLPVPGGFAVAAEAQGEFGKQEEPESNRSTITPQLALELRKAWDRNIGGSRAAVRSSALLEDSVDASFAGQFHSVLNVGSAEDLLKAVHECWESAYTSHASAYTARRTGLPSSGVRANRMAVVVQRMVDAEFAGVVFSSDPATESSGVLFAEWVDGLGEELVGGERIAGRCWLDSDGGELRVDHLGQSSPPQSVWRELTGIVRRIEQHFGVPQDIEWAVAQGRLHILQARPITTQPRCAASREEPPPWILPGRPASGWTKLQRRYFDLWDEYCPATVTPLDYGLFTRDIWQASLSMLDEGEGAPSIDAGVIRFHDVPVAVDPGAELQLRPKRQRRPAVEEELPTWRSLVESLKEQIGELRTTDVASLVEIVQETGRLHGHMTSIRLLGTFEWIDGERSCTKELARLAGLEGLSERMLDDLCAGVEHETARMNIALEELKRKSASAAGRLEWMAEFDQFINQFGHMEINGTIAHSAKDDLIAYVETGARSKEGVSRSGDLAAVGKERARRQRQRILERVDDDQREAADRCIDRLRELRVVREDSKSLANLPLPILRDAINECTQRLQARGMLKQDETVDLLTPAELRRGLVLGEELPNVQARREAIEWKRQRSWLPAGFLGEICSPRQRSFTGLGASRGSATGPARVVRGVEDFAKVRRGDVLVASNTNPAWTILFGRVAAVVVENGSRLSHAAIVAREYGIPAVVGLLGFCDAIGDGEEMRVDGDTGNVERLTGRECGNG